MYFLKLSALIRKQTFLQFYTLCAGASWYNSRSVLWESLVCFLATFPWSPSMTNMSIVKNLRPPRINSSSSAKRLTRLILILSSETLIEVNPYACLMLVVTCFLNFVASSCSIRLVVLRCSIPLNSRTGSPVCDSPFADSIIN